MTPRPHVPWLNTLRGLASLAVCAAHTHNALVSPLTGLDHPTDKWWGAVSTLAVYVFFAVSGYSIALSLVGNVRRNGGRFAAGSFASDRLARLVPPLLAAVAVTAGVYLIVAGLHLHGAESYRLGGEKFVLREKVRLDGWELAAPLLFVQTLLVPHGVAMNGSLWSLPFEFWFYVMAALVTAAVVNRRWVAGGLLALWAVGYWNTNGVHPVFVWYLPVWCVGCLAAVRIHHPRLSRSPAVRVAYAAAATGSAIVLVWAIARYGITVLDVYRVGVPTAVVYAALAVAVVASAGSSVGKWLGERSRPGRVAAALDRAADYSYTLYVVHFPLLLLAQSLVRPAIRDFGVGPTAGVAVTVFVGVNVAASRLARTVENRDAYRPLFRRAIDAVEAIRWPGVVRTPWRQYNTDRSRPR